MSVRLGTIELTRLQTVEVDEGRNLVEHRLPGGIGSVFQDLGRGSIRLNLRGLLLGEHALLDIETLRSAHAEATPLQFSADIAAGSDLTDVIIEDVQVQQIPGYTSRYEFALRICEWKEPPESIGAANALVDQEVAADAATWSAEALAIAGGLDDPGALAGLLANAKDLLARIDVSELAQAVIGAIGGLDASDFAHLASALTGIDADKFIGLLEALGEADSLGDVFGLLADDGIDLLQQLSGIDLSGVSPLVQAFLGGPEFLDLLDAVRKAANALLADIAGLKVFGELEALNSENLPQP